MPFNPDDPEFKRAAQVSSAFANRAYISMQGGLARIVFGEAPMQVADTRYHTAVTMSVVDALDLARAIYDTYAEYAPPPPPLPNLPRLGDPLGGIGGFNPRKGDPFGGS